MQPSDFTNMQKGFFEGVSQSTSRLVSAWSEAMQAAGTQNIYGMYQKFMLDWLSPSVLLRMMESSSMAVMIQEFVRLAAQDLQDLVKGASNQEKVESIKEKWIQTYEGIIREFFGIPSPDEAECLLQRWRSMIECLAGTGGGLQSQFIGMALSAGMAFPAAAAACQTVLPLCAET